MVMATEFCELGTCRECSNFGDISGLGVGVCMDGEDVAKCAHKVSITAKQRHLI
jgi:hypothetical protein